MSSSRGELPGWVDVILLPGINLALALFFSGLIILMLGENPLTALGIMLEGSVGSLRGWSFTLYYATTFTFTGLAVAIAFRAGLFNIGGEGQAYIAGLGPVMVGLGLGFLPWPVLVPLSIVASMALGAAWAFLPGYFQARRGSHIVITTIMFNFIASSLMVWIIRDFLRPRGSMAVESPEITSVSLPSFYDIGTWAGVKLPNTPFNVSVFLAVLAAIGVWFLLWRTRLGYAIRTVGASPQAAHYAGIKTDRIIVISMLISGAIAGLVPMNEILGAQHRLLLDFVGGAGFVGIAVALMGRSHPVGVVLAALLFGMLSQGGAELSMERPTITRDMIIVIQGMVILFMGALENTFRPFLQALLFKPGE